MLLCMMAGTMAGHVLMIGNALLAQVRRGRGMVRPVRDKAVALPSTLIWML